MDVELCVCVPVFTGGVNPVYPGETYLGLNNSIWMPQVLGID